MLASPRLSLRPLDHPGHVAQEHRPADGVPVGPGSRAGGSGTRTGTIFRSATTCSGRGPSRPITRMGFSTPPSTE